MKRAEHQPRRWRRSFKQPGEFAVLKQETGLGRIWISLDVDDPEDDR